jgi:peptidase M28-like protein
MKRLLAALSLLLAAVPVDGMTAPRSPSYDHLRAILNLSAAPDYRRAGSPGMAAVADYAAGRFQAAGYRVVRLDFPFRRYAIDYSAGHSPLLQRSDGLTFKTESGFDLDQTTPASGVTCVVKRPASVKPGDCGFVPFGKASPEWKNIFVDTSLLDQIVAAHGAGAIVQGDVARDLVFAMRIRRKLPTVIAVAHPEELLGKRVTLRAMGSYVSSTGHDVVAVQRPPAGSNHYVMLLAHGDGWFQAGADNGSGAAAVLRAAELLAESQPGIGVIAAITDAEEVGLIGADRLAQAIDGGLAVGDGGPPIVTKNIKAVVNLDASSARASEIQNSVRGIARTDLPLFSWRAMVSSESPLLTAAFIARFASHRVLGLPVPAAVWKPVSGGSLTSRHRSDVAPFEERGIPFVWPVVGYPEYHTDGDTLAAVDPQDLERVARSAAELVGDIALLPLGRVPGPLR